MAFHFSLASGGFKMKVAAFAIEFAIETNFRLACLVD